MSKRDIFIGAWVYKEEKEIVSELAKGMNISVSDLIRHRVIRPMMTIPEAVQNLKLYIDSKFNNFTYNITKIIKELSFNKPIKRTMIIEEYGDVPIERIKRPPPKILDIIDIPPEMAKSMKKVMKEMTKKVSSKEGFKFEIVPEEILKQPRPIPDPIAYLEWKIKVKGRKRLRENSVFVS